MGGMSKDPKECKHNWHAVLYVKTVEDGYEIFTPVPEGKFVFACEMCGSYYEHHSPGFLDSIQYFRNPPPR